MTTPRSESAQYHETIEVHSQLIRCPLTIEESRVYWERVTPGERPKAKDAFEQYWFGAKSLPWVRELINNLQRRFGAFPAALQVLGAWHSMTPETRAAICHWHLQFTDPLYRAFSGDFLIARREAGHDELHRNTVIVWVAENGRPGWTLPTRKQMATRLLSVALTADLVARRRDPRKLIFPRVGDEALTYILYFLRMVTFAGSLLDNPYLRSVGLEGTVLESRLHKLPSLDFRRVGDVMEFDWQYASLNAWADAELHSCGVAS